MRFLILYKTKYQTAKDYALWLKEELKNTDAVNVNQYKSIEITKYDVIIFGSSIEQNSISIISFINEHFEEFAGKPLYLFSVGMAYPIERRTIDYSKQIPSKIKSGMRGYYHLPGRFNFSKLDWSTRFLFWLRGVKQNDAFVKKKKLIPLIKNIKHDFNLR